MATAAVLKHSIDPATLESRAVRSRDAFGALEFPGAARSYGRNEEVFGEGGRADYFYRIVSGTVRLYRVLADGRRQIASFQFEGDVFGVEASEYRHLSAEAVNDCEIVATPRTAILRHAERNGDFARRMWARAVTDLAEAHDHMLVLGRKT
ncbi:MAG: cyclic nucleotide-binding domain-containing protein, partial [Alphaproteobacteria bacterium]